MTKKLKFDPSNYAPARSRIRRVPAMTIVALAAKYGVSVSRMDAAVRSGLPIAQALKYPPGTIYAKLVEFERVLVPLSQLCAIYDVPIVRVRSRLRDGWELKEALTLAKGSRRGNA
jgi:hypothetical protein